MAVDFDRFLQGAVLDRQTEDPAVFVVTVGVPNVVLHVADDDVLPVGNIQRAVFADDRVGGTEISVLTVQQFQSRRSPYLAELAVGAVSFAIK